MSRPTWRVCGVGEGVGNINSSVSRARRGATDGDALSGFVAGMIHAFDVIGVKGCYVWL